MSGARRLLARLNRRPQLAAASLLGPGTLWLLLFFFVPIAVVFAYSFMTRGVYGGVTGGFTLEHYRRFLDPLYLGVLRRTVTLAVSCTVLCLAVGYPMAYTIARAGRWKSLLLFLVVVPLWTSFLVRTYALIFLLRDTGFVNAVLLALGVVREPLVLLYTPGAVLAGLVYGYLPLMVLPIYVSLEKLDPTLLEAAEVLGARPLARFWRITLPLSAPGVVEIVAGAVGLACVTVLAAFAGICVIRESVESGVVFFSCFSLRPRPSPNRRPGRPRRYW
jgi:spermidine/putrescine transport system permease protein